MTVSLTQKLVWKEKISRQKRSESLAELFVVSPLNKFEFKAHLSSLTQTTAITGCNTSLIERAEVSWFLFTGQTNIDSGRISSLIYSVSPLPDAETWGEIDINNSPLLFPPGQPVCFFILNVELLTLFEIRSMASLPPDAQQSLQKTVPSSPAGKIGRKVALKAKGKEHEGKRQLAAV